MSAQQGKETRHVLLLGTHTLLRDAVERILEPKFLVVRRSIEHPSAETNLPAVLVMEWLARMPPSTVGQHVRAGEALVLVTDGGVANLRALAAFPRIAGVVLTSEIDYRLVDAVRQCSARLPRARLLTALTTGQIAPRVRAVARRMLERADWAQPAEVVVRDVIEVPALVGCSRSDLYKEADLLGVHLPSLVDAVRCFAALEMRATTGKTWAQVASRLGYESGGGLTALMKRTIGRTPHTVDLDDLEVALLRVISVASGSLRIRGNEA